MIDNVFHKLPTGGIHIPRGQIFGNFEPPPPTAPIMVEHCLNFKTWSFGQPPIKPRTTWSFQDPPPISCDFKKIFLHFFCHTFGKIQFQKVRLVNCAAKIENSCRKPFSDLKRKNSIHRTTWSFRKPSPTWSFMVISWTPSPLIWPTGIWMPPWMTRQEFLPTTVNTFMSLSWSIFTHRLGGTWQETLYRYSKNGPSSTAIVQWRCNLYANIFVFHSSDWSRMKDLTILK